MTPRVPPESNKPTSRQGSPLSSAREGLPDIDLQGLARAIARLDGVDNLEPTVVALIQRELVDLEQKAQRFAAFAQRINIELRQLREHREQDDQLQADKLRAVQEGNDSFVAQLIAEHEAEVSTLQRERDAAIERVRELSRGISRVGGMSSPSIRRASTARFPATNPATSSDTALLQARLEELQGERDRSLKLLRQLAEQRDRSEARYQALLAEIGGADVPAQRSPFASESATNAELPAALTPATASQEERSPFAGAALAPPPPLCESPPVSTTDAGLHGSNEVGVSDPKPESAIMRTAQPVAGSSAIGDATADLDDNWDLSAPSHPRVSAPNELAGVRPTDSQDEPGSDQPPAPAQTVPLLRRKTLSPSDMGGAYALSSADNLPVEEVIVRRGEVPRKDR